MGLPWPMNSAGILVILFVPLELKIRERLGKLRNCQSNGSLSMISQRPIS